MREAAGALVEGDVPSWLVWASNLGLKLWRPPAAALARLRDQLPRPGLTGGVEAVGVSSFRSVLIRMLGVDFVPRGVPWFPGGDADRVRSVSEG